jgi:predicted oxidoreductase
MYPNHADSPEKIVEYALGNGITYFDAAQDYISSEGTLGVVPGEKKVITKLLPTYNHKDIHSLTDSLSSSLTHLQADKIYGVLLHNGDYFFKLDQFLKDATELKRRGVIEKVGVSVYDPEAALKYSMIPDIDIIQVPFNIFDRRLIDNGFYKTKKEIYIRSVFLRGAVFLLPEELRERGLIHLVDPVTDMKRFLANRGSIPIHQFCIQAVKYIFPEAKIIIGADSVEELKQNIEADSRCLDYIVAMWYGRKKRYPEKVVDIRWWDE